MAHSYILGPLCDQSSINETLYRRMLNFIHSVIRSSNDTVAYTGQLALRSALTPLGYNISYLRETFDIDFARSRKQNMSILKKSNWLSDHQLSNVTTGIELHEMLDVHPCAFTRPEVYQMLITYVQCDRYWSCKSSYRLRMGVFCLSRFCCFCFVFFVFFIVFFYNLILN